MLASPIQGNPEEPTTDSVPPELVRDGDPELQLRRTDAGKAQVADDPLNARHFCQRDEPFVVHVIQRAEGTGEPLADARRIAEKARCEAVWGQPRIEGAQVVAV